MESSEKKLWNWTRELTDQDKAERHFHEEQIQEKKGNCKIILLVWTQEGNVNVSDGKAASDKEVGPQSTT